MNPGSVSIPDATRAFRGFAGHVATGVSIVVTMNEGEPLATTVGSLVAASWEPPLLAIMLQAGSRMDVALGRCGQFTVNLLGEADHGLARRFSRSGRIQGWDAFAGIPLQRRDPLPPVFAAAVAWASCDVTQVIPLGDHRCHVGEVREAERDGAAAPLIYYRGRFRGLGTAVAPAAWSPTDAADFSAVW
jgi:3-hydroxy-9,10-secoandrosta-1,3,5(10)-triene-9,17-dione monooxygenase reductase component